MLKQILATVLLAWYFDVALVYREFLARGLGIGASISTLGPYATKQQCEEHRKQILEMYEKPSASVCRFVSK